MVLANFGDTRIVIGIPTSDHQAADLLIATIYGMLLPPVQFCFTSGCYVDRNRNGIVKMVLDGEYDKALGGPCTHILLIDSDTVPTSRFAFKKLFEADKGVISGLSFYKEWPPHPMIWKWKDRSLYGKERAIERIVIGETINPMLITEEYRNKVIEVDGVGFGFILIKREVFEKMGPPWFTSWQNENHVYHGEDINFCFKSQNLGYKTYVHTGVISAHKIGRSYSPFMYQDMFDQIRENYDITRKEG